MRNHEEAIRDFNQAIDLAENSPDAYIYRGVSLLKLRKPAEAIKDFEKALDLDSESPKIYNGLGMAYHLLGDREEALENLNKALEKETTVEFLIDRSKIYLDLEMYDSAYEDLSKSLDIRPDDPELYYKRGIVLFAS